MLAPRTRLPSGAATGEGSAAPRTGDAGAGSVTVRTVRTARRPVRTASTIKLPILIAVYTAVEAGKVHWTDTSELTKENKVGGSGVLAEMSDGTKIPLRDLVRYMMLLSDNSATNMVLDHVDGNDVNAVMEKLGIKSTRSLRKIQQRPRRRRRRPPHPNRHRRSRATGARRRSRVSASITTAMRASARSTIS